MSLQVLGSLLCELFLFWLDQFCVSQGGLELRDSSVSVSHVLRLKMCATSAWLLWLTSVASFVL